MVRLDPMQRAKDFTRERHPRNRSRTNVASQIVELQQQMLTNSFLVSQPQQETFIETLAYLPEPVSDDLGRIILVQLPGETLSSSYIGTIGPDDVVFWQRLAFGIGAGGATSPEFTFVGNASGGLNITGVWEDVSSIYFVDASINMNRYEKSSGLITSALFNANVTGSTALSKDGSGNYYVTQPGNTRIRKLSSSAAILATTVTSKTYNSVFHRLGTANLFATSAVDNQWFKIRASDLVVLNTVSTSISGPQGICEDSNGNIYVANSGNNTIRKYNSALTFLLAWGSPGSGNSQFSTPKQMWVDSSNRIYVADSGNDRIQVFDVAGVFLGKFASSGVAAAQIDNPSGVSVFGNDITVADTGNGRISRWIRA